MIEPIPVPDFETPQGERSNQLIQQRTLILLKRLNSVTLGLADELERISSQAPSYLANQLIADAQEWWLARMDDVLCTLQELKPVK